MSGGDLSVEIEQRSPWSVGSSRGRSIDSSFSASDAHNAGVELAIEHLRRVDVKLSVNCRIGDPFILFLHGLAGYGAEWFGVAEYLGESVGLLIPDQRGHGASWGPSGVDVGREDYVGDAVALIETRQQPPRCGCGPVDGGNRRNLFSQRPP